jgi:hypothetical protein
MAKQVQIILFTFDELPDESKSKLIEGMRENLDPFYGHIYDEFINDMAEKYGACIELDNIQWSGFWSQGDGASFICDFDEEVIYPILKEELTEDQISFLDEHDILLCGASSQRYGPHYYSHENTVRGAIDFDIDMSSEEEALEERSLLSLEETRIVMESKLTEIIRESCTDLYQRLKDEYERATTTEAIIEEIKNAWPGCNFRKDGTIFAR